MRRDIVPAAVFPDYELSDHMAKRRKLSELQGQHPMILVLSRGGFCPKDRRQAEGLVARHRVGYCRLVTISTDNITHTNEYRSGVGSRQQSDDSPCDWRDQRSHGSSGSGRTVKDRKSQASVGRSTRSSGQSLYSYRFWQH
jgi:hypothetical protein